MTQFSANLGFLWTDRPLADAIRAAKAAGFDAVECHWPYDQPARDLREALAETGLKMLGLNTRRGDPGENGLSALPGREVEARAAIDEALAYAGEIGAQKVHVMAGFDQTEAGRATFFENLRYACAQAAKQDRAILIEPLNAADAPGYAFHTTAEAVEIIDAVGAPNLALMFDCYHVGRTEGDVIGRLNAVYAHIGHIQFASVPDRGTPDQGTLDYRAVFAEIAALGWSLPLGAEYKPQGATGDSLAWMRAFR